MINAKFIAGMLAMALAFGMTGCPQGTTTETKTEYVNTGGSGGGDQGQPPSTDNQLSAKTWDELDALLDFFGDGEATIYVTDKFEAQDNITLADGQTLVIADQEYANAQPKPNGPNIQLSLNGPANPAARLTIPAPYTLTVEDGAAVVVGNPSDTAKTGVLLIQGGGGLTVKDGGYLGVTTASRVLVEKPESGAEGGLDLQDGATVLALGTGAQLIGLVPTDGSPAPLIAIEKDASGVSAPAIIGDTVEFKTVAGGFDDEEVKLTAEDLDTAADEGDTDTGAAAEAADVAAASSAKVTNDMDTAKGWLADAVTTKVTYTGDTAFDEVINAPGKTLVIEGAISSGQTKPITVGILEVTNSITTTAAITATTQLKTTALSQSATGRPRPSRPPTW
jgi:hypothetical protein